MEDRISLEPRDPDRIPRVIAKLQRLWEQYPDWRLGQLIINVSPVREDIIWYAEEDQWERRLDEWLRERPVRTGS